MKIYVFIIRRGDTSQDDVFTGSRSRRTRVNLDQSEEDENTTTRLRSRLFPPHPSSPTISLLGSAQIEVLTFEDFYNIHKRFIFAK